MLIKTEKDIPASEITDPQVFANRRTLLKSLLAMAAVGGGLGRPASANAENLPELSPTPPAIAHNYTNYYEFSYRKSEATELAQALRTDPWQLEIGGEVEKGGKFYLEDILKQQALSERIYRFRCVEAWSMVIPWLGFPLAALIKQARPLSSAKFVKFISVYQPESMPNQANNAILAWPYVEGLRLDEAMHPLTLLAVGMYGETLAKQNGAPLRLVVPWKYGFKSIKAIVKIDLLSHAPLTSWHRFAPNDYGFYANVNPNVPHPRWSQHSERLLGSGFFTPRRKTELFNGYGEQVAGLYNNMDLRHFF